MFSVFGPATIAAYLVGSIPCGPIIARLYGKAGALRAASAHETALWQKRVGSVRFTKGHALIWRDMNMVREIEFDRIEPVHVGRMTQGLWRGTGEIGGV